MSFEFSAQNLSTHFHSHVRLGDPTLPTKPISYNSMKSTIFPRSLSEASCGQNLDELIESLGAGDASADVDCPPSEGGVEEKHLSDAAAEEEEIRPNEEEEDGAEEEQEEQEMPDASEHLGETDIQEAVAEQPVSGLRRRNRLE